MTLRRVRKRWYPTLSGLIAVDEPLASNDEVAVRSMSVSFAFQGAFSFWLNTGYRPYESFVGHLERARRWRGPGTASSGSVRTQNQQ